MRSLPHRFVAALVIGAAALLLPTVAFAADTSTEDSPTVIWDLSPASVSIIVGFLLPLLVGLVTKVSTPSSVKGVLLLLLSAVSGLLAQAAVEDAGFAVTQEALISAGITFAIGVATHYGLWRPTGATARVQAAGVKD